MHATAALSHRDRTDTARRRHRSNRRRNSHNANRQRLDSELSIRRNDNNVHDNIVSQLSLAGNVQLRNSRAFVYSFRVRDSPRILNMTNQDLDLRGHMNSYHGAHSLRRAVVLDGRHLNVVLVKGGQPHAILDLLGRLTLHVLSGRLNTN